MITLPNSLFESLKEQLCGEEENGTAFSETILCFKKGNLFDSKNRCLKFRNSDLDLLPQIR